MPLAPHIQAFYDNLPVSEKRQLARGPRVAKSKLGPIVNVRLEPYTRRDGSGEVITCTYFDTRCGECGNMTTFIQPAPNGVPAVNPNHSKRCRDCIDARITQRVERMIASYKAARGALAAAEEFY